MAVRKENLKQNAINNLIVLKDSLGWKIIEKALDENIRQIESKLHGETKLEGDETIEILQKQWYDRKRLRSLPADLIEEYKDKKEFPMELDPYA